MKKKQSYPIELTVNGELKKTEVFAGETLLHALREKLGHTEVKEGCGKGDCGACAVLLNGRAVNACLTLALQADG
jgi:aerobic-type carbon monoxide dehydrogenase small subunit (CoxS/CutS family)